MSYGTPPPPPGGPYGEQPYGQPGGNQPYGQQPGPYGQPYGQPYQQQGYGGPPSYGPGGPQAGDPGTLDLPYYGIGFGGAFNRFWAKYARFDGRASRSEYWWATLANALIGLVIYVPLVIAVVSDSPAATAVLGILFLAYVLATIVPGIAISVRRLHDGGFSGWMYLLGFIPLVGGIIVLVLMCLPPKPEGQRYDRVTQPPAGGYGGQG